MKTKLEWSRLSNAATACRIKQMPDVCQVRISLHPLGWHRARRGCLAGTGPLQPHGAIVISGAFQLVPIISPYHTDNGRITCWGNTVENKHVDKEAKQES